MGDPEVYRTEDEVSTYDEDRFEDLSWRKKYFDIFERGCVTKYIEPGTTLDVGCGTARLGFINDYTGVDFSEPMLEKARQKYPNNDYVQSDARDLPFDDDSFDNVVSTRLIMHIEDWDQAIAEMHRVCKPGGRVIVDIKPPGIMSVLLRWRQKTLHREDLDMNIVPMSFFDQYTIIDTADFPWFPAMTRFVILEKEP